KPGSAVWSCGPSFRPVFHPTARKSGARRDLGLGKGGASNAIRDTFSDDVPYLACAKPAPGRGARCRAYGALFFLFLFPSLTHPGSRGATFAPRLRRWFM